MPAGLERPTGAFADVSELEYIAAIHQTTDDDKDTFVDGSIDASDVKVFLLSRYGISVTEEEVKESIFRDIGGGVNGCIDLVEVVSLLIIPYLSKVAFVNAHTTEHQQVGNKNSNQSQFEKEALAHFDKLREDSNDSIFGDVLNFIMAETTGSKDPQPLTKELMSKIFKKYNEEDLIEDDTLLEEMIDMASGGKTGLAREVSSSLPVEDFDITSQQGADTNDSFEFIMTPDTTNNAEADLITEEIAPFDGKKDSLAIGAYAETTEKAVLLDENKKKDFTSSLAIGADAETIDEDTILDEKKHFSSAFAFGAGVNATDEDSFTTGTLLLDAAAFTRGLTDDIKLYDPFTETKYTTHYEDVFGTAPKGNSKELKGYNEVDNAERGEAPDDGNNEVREVRRVFTLSQIDSQADTFRDKNHYIIAWLSIIFVFLSYTWGFVTGFAPFKCEPDDLGCKIANSIALWSGIFAFMAFAVAPLIILITLGNDSDRQSPYHIAGGICAIAACIFTPAITYPVNSPFSSFMDETTSFSSKALQGSTVTFGVLLLLIQFSSILRFFVSDDALQNSKVLTSLLRGSGVRAEFGIKISAALKIHHLVKNAYDLHPEVSGRDDYTKSNVMLNYNKEMGNSEPFGGFVWAWKQYFNGDLLNREGIWIHSRLQVAFFAQFLSALIFIVLTAGVIVNKIIPDVDRFRYRENPATSESNLCWSIFDPASCTYPTVDGVSLGIGVCTNVTFLNEICRDYYPEVKGWKSFGYCALLREGGVVSDEFMNVTSTCPPIYESIETTFGYYLTSDQDNDNWCAASASVCTGDKEDADSYSCIIGLRQVAPFQFSEAGSGCSELAQNDENFDKLLTQVRIVNNATVAFQQSAADLKEQLFPKKTTVVASLTAGLLVAGVAAIWNSLVSIPSQVLVTLRFRTGSVETLRDPRFKVYRKGILQTTYLIGAAIWSSFFMILLIFVIVSVAVFLFSYHITRPVVLNFIAVFIGIGVTIIIKILLAMILDKFNYQGFYRKHPMFANFSNVCFECWHLVITSGFVLSRVIKLLAIVLLYAGRYDQQLLANGVGEIGMKSLDTFPHLFKVDLLSIDAHRHPYIERLGMMYMMKLRHGRNFGNRAGSTWRLLFVTALMPWLRKYRISEEEEKEDDLSDKR